MMAPTPEQLYKWTNSGGVASNGGSGKWSLPRGGKPGAWKSVTGDIVPCVNGLHLCREKDLLKWIGEELYEAEHYKSSERIDHSDKIVVRKARLVRRVETINDQTIRLFAADCAERVLKHYEAKYPSDHRPRMAILAARQYAFGEIETAARDAAWAAAWDAVRDAAGAAAWDAARDAVRAAAWAAARAAAWDAAGAAVRAAAWAAARAAAWDAAWAAVRAAAWDAAGAAETEWQANRLMEYVRGEVDLDALRKSLEQ